MFATCIYGVVGDTHGMLKYHASVLAAFSLFHCRFLLAWRSVILDPYLKELPFPSALSMAAFPNLITTGRRPRVAYAIHCHILFPFKHLVVRPHCGNLSGQRVSLVGLLLEVMSDRFTNMSVIHEHVQKVSGRCDQVRKYVVVVMAGGEPILTDNQI